MTLAGHDFTSKALSDWHKAMKKLASATNWAPSLWVPGDTVFDIGATNLPLIGPKPTCWVSYKLVRENMSQWVADERRKHWSRVDINKQVETMTPGSDRPRTLQQVGSTDGKPLVRRKQPGGASSTQQILGSLWREDRGDEKVNIVKTFTKIWDLTERVKSCKRRVISYESWAAITSDAYPSSLEENEIIPRLLPFVSNVPNRNKSITQTSFQFKRIANPTPNVIVL